MTTAFLQQRLHPAVKIEHTVTVVRGKRSSVLHIQQCELAGACGLHCAAMALTVTGHITDAAALPSRRRGIAAQLWQAAKPYYFDGIFAEEVSGLLTSLQTDLHVTHCAGSHRQCLQFALDHLARGQLAMISWISKNGNDAHWTLALGTEGMLRHRTYTPETILCLDPSHNAPEFTAYNCRLRFAENETMLRKAYLPYTCASGWTVHVRLTGVVAIGTVANKF